MNRTIESPSESEAELAELTIGRRRVATIFDAVEGTVMSEFFNSKGDTAMEYEPRKLPLTPDEVLFRCKKAPQRYEEYDIYRAHDELPQGGLGALPDSDMLRAIHSYVRRFFKSLARGKRLNVNERSMDETALLAFGILLEEAVREILGENGDLVFTERAGADGEARKKAKRQNLLLPREEEKRCKKKSAVTDDADEVAQRSSKEISLTPDRGASDMGTGGDEVAAGCCHVNREGRGSKRPWSDDDGSDDEDEVEHGAGPRIQSTVGKGVSVLPKTTRKRAKKKAGFC